MHDDFGTMQYFYMLTKGNATLLRKVEPSAKAVHCKKRLAIFPSRPFFNSVAVLENPPDYQHMWLFQLGGGGGEFLKWESNCVCVTVSTAVLPVSPN
jgi:hypothetical protein